MSIDLSRCLTVSLVVEAVDEDIERAVGNHQPHGQELKPGWSVPAGQTFQGFHQHEGCVTNGKRHCDYQERLNSFVFPTSVFFIVWIAT